MTRILRYLVVLVLMLAIVACGDDDANGDSSEPVTVANATSCEQLMDLFIPMVQDLLDATTDMSLAEFTSTTEPPEFVTEFEASSEEFGAKSDELECDADEMESLFEARVGDLTADGEIAEMLLRSINEMSFD